MPLTAKVKKRAYMFASLMMCCLSASLLAASFATEYWFVSDSVWIANGTNIELGTGSVNFGLFKGMNEINGGARRQVLYVVCLDGQCMYSCAPEKEDREKQMQKLLNGETDGLKDDCPRETESSRQRLTMLDTVPARMKQDVADSRTIHIPALFHPMLSSEYRGVVPHRGGGEQVEGIEHLRPQLLESSDADTPTTGELEFMDYGLWVGTIACLSGGLLMAVVGALFAVVNTATTPVEAITGVPGLYLWNGLAAVFDLITVILWAVQFHQHLSTNVLLYDSNDGWTTEGMQVFGYSFWLVVVAIFVHVANIAIIAIGTYEPKKKTQLEAPDSKGGNIMLY